MALVGHQRIRAERELGQAIRTGKLVDLRTGQPEADDPVHGATWGQPRTVRAELLAELLTQQGEGSRRPRALRLAGARIIGTLDLEGVELVCPLLLRGCWFDEPIALTEAQAVAIRLPGCRLPGLQAARLVTRGNLELDEGFIAEGEVVLRGAHIGGALSFMGATLTNHEGPALNADRFTVDQGVYCYQGFTALGEIRLVGAHIYVQLAFDGATLSNPHGRALNANSLTVDQSMLCRRGFTAHGEVNLVGAHIGDLELTGATLSNLNGHALNAGSLTVDQSMLCGGFTAHGEVNLAGAHIGGQLSLTGATLSNPDGRALNADSLTVDWSTFCTEGFTAQGEVNLLEAHIGAQFDLTKATLTNPNGPSLNLQAAQVGTLLLRPAVAPSWVDLGHAKVGVLADNQATWPDKLHLVGLTYDALAEYPTVSAKQRLGWLRLDSHGYAPQPYEHLAVVYRRAGRDEDARRVAIAKQRRRRRTLSWPARLGSLLLDGLVGYGYRTWLAAIWLIGLVAVGWWLFDLAHPGHLIAAKPPGERPWFHAGAYTLDLLLPFANLGYQDNWIVHGWEVLGLYVLWNLAGWVLTTAVVAALTGLLKRE